MPNKDHGGTRRGAGRPKNGATIRKTVTLDAETLAILLSISPKLSEAIRLLSKQHTGV